MDFHYHEQGRRVGNFKATIIVSEKKNAVLLSFYWFTKKDIPLVLQLAPFIQVLINNDKNCLDRAP